MHEAFPRLAQLFLGERERLPRGALRALAAADGTRQARQDLNSAAPQSEWPAVWQQVLDHLPELLDISLLDLLLSGLERSDLLAAVAERSRLEPRKNLRIPLPDATLVTEHQPSMDFLVDGRPVGLLDFTVRLALDLSGTEVVVENGRLCALLTGACSGGGELRIGETRFLARRFEDLRLPAEVQFEPGITVPAHGHPYTWGEGPAQAEVVASARAPRPGAGRVHHYLAGLGILAFGLLVGRNLDDHQAAPPATLPQPAPRSVEQAAQELPEPLPAAAPAPALPQPEGPASAAAEPVPAGPVHALTILPYPPQARVRIMNIAPVYEPAMPLPAGRYQVRVDHPGYVTREEWVEIGDRDLVLDLALEPEAAAAPSASAPSELPGFRVFLRASPPDAQVSVLRGGRMVAFRSGARLPPGNYSFTVSHPGYRPALRLVQVNDRDVEVEVRLQRDFIH